MLFSLKCRDRYFATECKGFPYVFFTFTPVRAPGRDTGKENRAYGVLPIALRPRVDQCAAREGVFEAFFGRLVRSAPVGDSQEAKIPPK